MNNNWLNKVQKLTESNKVEILNSEGGKLFLIDKFKPVSVLKRYEKVINVDEIDMPNAFIDLILNKRKGSNTSNISLLEMPIAATNILFKSIALIKSSQFSPKSRPQQLELFNKEFKKNVNTRVSLTIDIKDISFSTSAKGIIKGKRDKVREAIDFLQHNLYIWAITTNADGKQKDEKLSYIESPSFTTGKVSFEMNIFWFEQLIKLEGYNSVILDLPSILGNTRHVMFSLYIERFEANKWMQWNFKKINEIFDLNYSDANTLAKAFLHEMKIKLDNNALKSFQYTVSGELINILIYNIKNLPKDSNIKLLSPKLIKQKRFTNYLCRRHEISNEKKQSILDVLKNSEGDFELLYQAYEDYKVYCRKNKISVLDFKKEEFLNKWNLLISERYKETNRYLNFSNGSPRI